MMGFFHEDLVAVRGRGGLCRRCLFTNTHLSHQRPGVRMMRSETPDSTPFTQR